MNLVTNNPQLDAHLTTTKGRPDVVQVRLVDVVRCLGLHDVQLSAQIQEVIVEMDVGHDFCQVVIVVMLLRKLQVKLEEKIILSNKKPDDSRDRQMF